MTVGTTKAARREKRGACPCATLRLCWLLAALFGFRFRFRFRFQPPKRPKRLLARPSLRPSCNYSGNLGWDEGLADFFTALAGWLPGGLARLGKRCVLGVFRCTWHLGTSKTPPSVQPCLQRARSFRVAMQIFPRLDVEAACLSTNAGTPAHLHTASRCVHTLEPPCISRQPFRHAQCRLCEPLFLALDRVPIRSASSLVRLPMLVSLPYFGPVANTR